MKQCFGYIRVSTAKQGQGVSLEAQKDAILSFAGQNGVAISDWFEEQETAAKSGRPIFNTMIRLLKQGRAAGVVMHKIDRSARNFADWAKIGELSDAGIDVHFATEHLDFRSRGGRLSADLQAVIAADYIRNLREETIKGINGRLKQGLYPFKAPIGYLNNGRGQPKTLDPNSAPLVRQAFELYASGQHSYYSLWQEMNRRGLLNEKGRPISQQGIEKLLGNPFHCGIIRINTTGETYRGTHEPIISPSVFERVQDVRAGKAGKKVTRHNHTYRGLFRCSHCEFVMSPELQKGHVYYRCQTRGCPTTTVREEDITDAVTEMLGRIAFSSETIATITADIDAWFDARGRADPRKNSGMQLSHIDSRLDRLTDAMVDQVIDRSEYLRRKQTLLLERARLEEQLQKGAPKRDDARTIGKFLELVRTLSSHYILMLPHEKREIVEMITSNRTVIGKSVVLEPQNWVHTVQNTVSVYGGDPYRGTSRTFNTLRLEQMLCLIRNVQDCRLWSMFRQKKLE